MKAVASTGGARRRNHTVARSPHRILILAGALAGSTAAAAPAQNGHLSAQERGAVGCYRLTVAEGLPADTRSRIPPMIALRSDRREHGIWLRMDPGISLDGRDFRGAWRLHPYGGLRAMWSDGLSGLLIVASWTGDGFGGTARTLTAPVGSNASESPIRARRTPCPKSLTPSAPPP